MINSEQRPVVGATASDWEVLRQSQPSDYDGHTGFDRMSPAARLEWLEAAVEFVLNPRAGSR